MVEERTWDLSNLVEDTSIEGLTKDTELLLTRIQSAIDRLRDNQDGIKADRLAKHIIEIEAVIEGAFNIGGYSYCKYVSDTTAEGSQALLSIYSKFSSKWNELLTHGISRILGNIILEQPSIIDAPEVQAYRHLMERASKYLPYILSPIEEEIISEKDANGISAMSELYESWIGSHMIDVEIEGEMQSISANKAFSLLMDENRETRRAVSDAYYGSFARDRLLHVSALRAICVDHIKMTKRRKWPSYMTQSLLDQDVDENSIDALLKTVETESASYQKYIQLKAKYFGQERLQGYDLRAPWLKKAVWNRNWSDMKTSVIQTYQQFDDEIGNFIDGLFKNRRVDSEDCPGRASTAFTFPVFPMKTSYVFFTYNGTLNDAYIVAHELGHSVHSYFTDTTQSVLNTNYSMCLAETGSIFGELLFTEQLLKECTDDELKLEILAKVLDRFYQWVFHIGLYGLFEIGLFEFIQKGGYLDIEKTRDIWRENRYKIFGDSVEWSENLDYDWVRMGQLFYPNFRFYNYSYSFAQLVVFAFYDDYKENPSDFSERFKRFLSRGSSMSPKDQIAEMGHDITKPDFWKIGIRRAESFLEDLRKLV